MVFSLKCRVRIRINEYLQFRNTVHSDAVCVADDPHNQLVIAYNLVIDNKRIETAKAEYKDFFAVGGAILTFSFLVLISKADLTVIALYPTFLLLQVVPVPPFVKQL